VVALVSLRHHKISDKDNMKVVHLSSFPYLLSSGNNLRNEEHPKSWIKNLISGLDGYDCTNIVIALSPNTPKFIEARRRNNVTYVYINNIGMLNKFRSLLSIYLILRRICPDVIHIHGTENIYQIYWVFFYKKTLISVQGIINKIINYDAKKKYYFIKILEKISLKYSKFILAKTKYTVNYLEGIGRTKKTFFVEPSVSSFSVPTDELSKRVIFIGDTIQRKGIYDFLEIVKLLSGQGISFGVIGKKLSFDGVSNFINDKQIPTSELLFYGQMSHSEIEKILTARTIYLMCSHIENSSNSLIEALKSGIPSIAYNVGDTGNIITNEYNGFVVDPFDIGFVVELINRLFNDPKLYERIAFNSREHFKLLYSYSGVAHKHFQVYRCIQDASYNV